MFLRNLINVLKNSEKRVLFYDYANRLRRK